MRIYESTWWSIKISPGWFDQMDPECVTFCRQDGVGAFQISAAKNDNRAVLDEDLHEFSADQFPEGLSPQLVRCGEFTGLSVEYVTDGNFWLKRWLRNGRLLLFVTYNSNAEDHAAEIDDVVRMLDTLKPV
jgi:hypothetical protein